MLESYIVQLQVGEPLSVEQSYDCLMTIFEGDCSTAEIVTVLSEMAERGEAVSELVGFARAMREAALKVELPKPIIDLCGTGGTGKDRFNVSTTVAFIAAAMGIPVAKHGNRGSRKANGSFDFLEALGLEIILDVPTIERVFAETGLCFLFARSHHKAVAHVAEARKQFGKRSIFNLVGPLSNPANVTHQIIGTASHEVAEKLASALQQLGHDRAMVIVGGGGLDELSVSAENLILDVSQSGITEWTLDPAPMFPDVGTVTGGDAAENAQLFEEIFRIPQMDHPVMAMALLNAAAVAYCFGRSSSIEDGVASAREVVASGKVWEKFLQYKRLCRG